MTKESQLPRYTDLKIRFIRHSEYNPEEASIYIFREDGAHIWMSWDLSDNETALVFSEPQKGAIAIDTTSLPIQKLHQAITNFALGASKEEAVEIIPDEIMSRSK